MSQALASDGPVVQAKAIPPLTWDGTLVDTAETARRYLHLSAFLCEKCNGPVIAGSLGTREDDISREIDIREVGAACIACGFRPEILAEHPVDHHFRPIEWKWAIKEHAQPAVSSEPPRTELQDADATP